MFNGLFDDIRDRKMNYKFIKDTETFFSMYATSFNMYDKFSIKRFMWEDFSCRADDDLYIQVYMCLTTTWQIQPISTRLLVVMTWHIDLHPDGEATSLMNITGMTFN